MNIQLYALSTCPYCRMTKRYLDDHGIIVRARPRSTCSRATSGRRRSTRSSGSREARRFPVLVADDEVVVGFNKTRIADVLGL